MVSSATPPIGPNLGAAVPGFGTDGIRGRAGTVLTPALCLQVGYWMGQVLQQEGPVLIGMDSRSSGSMLVAALTAGLTAAGRDVWTLGLCPTPAVPLLIRQVGAAGGLMVSASHNPPADNGIKVFGADGSKLQSARQAQIEAGLRGDLPHQPIARCGVSCQRHDLLVSYRDALTASVGDLRLDGVPIVLDLCWGSATAMAAEVFAGLGADLTVLHGQPDGERINVACGSTQLEPLRQSVLDRGAAMGFAFDGDADRMLAVDGRGRVVDGDHVLFLWGSVLADRKALPDQRLVATVMSNLGFERAWQRRGGCWSAPQLGTSMCTRRWSPAVRPSAVNSPATSLRPPMASAVMVFSRRFSSPPSAIARASTSRPGWIAVSGLSPEAGERHRSRSRPSQGLGQLWALADAVHAAEASMGDAGRVLVRASGTEPVLRVMVEAERQEMVDQWTGQLAALADEHLNAA